MEAHELKPGLWRWTARHPDWDDREVSSACVVTPDTVVLVDPLVPRGHEVRFFTALDRDVDTGDTVVDGELCPEDWLAHGREHHVACLMRALELDADLVVPSHGEPFPVARLAALLHSPPSAA